MGWAGLGWAVLDCTVLKMGSRLPGHAMAGLRACMQQDSHISGSVPTWFLRWPGCGHACPGQRSGTCSMRAWHACQLWNNGYHVLSSRNGSQDKRSCGHSHKNPMQQQTAHRLNCNTSLQHASILGPSGASISDRLCQQLGSRCTAFHISTVPASKCLRRRLRRCARCAMRRSWSARRESTGLWELPRRLPWCAWWRSWACQTRPSTAAASTCAGVTKEILRAVKVRLWEGAAGCHAGVCIVDGCMCGCLLYCGRSTAAALIICTGAAVCTSVQRCGWLFVLRLAS